LPAQVVQRFRRSALIDTDPGLLQTWMTRGTVRVALHDTYFTIGETVGTPAARFPDCGVRWIYTPPPVFLPEWPATPINGAAPYTTVAHWWGGTFEHNGTTFWNEKRVAFLDYLELPARARVRLELAVCLAEYYEEYRQLMEPRGWRLREAWDVSSTPEEYRAYVQRSRGEFSCAKPAYVTLETAWVSDRTICYLASGKPAVVQYTGPSRFLPDADGLFRFRNLDEAAAALAAVEADYERHCRRARALAEEHFDSRRIVARVLERALERSATCAK
jgi:glycosyltransferase involved in cell wall biosynthesis